MPTDLPVELKESDLLKIIDKNRALDATYKMLEISLNSIDFTALTKNITDTVPKVLGYELGILFLADTQNNKIKRISSAIPIFDKEKSKKLQEMVEKINISLGYEDNLTVKSYYDGLQHVSENLLEMLKPALTAEEAHKMQKELGLQLVISTPLLSREKIIGVFVVGTSKSIDHFTNFEREMLLKFSENAGMAIENSKLFDDLKRAKEKLNKAYENLKVLNKMKDEFLTVASHELRTPMTIIKSYLWMLEQEKAGKITKEQKSYLDKASKGTQRMINLINDMLDISKFEQQKVTFDIKQLDLSQVIKETTDNFKVTAQEKGLSLTQTKEIENGNIFVDADLEKLKEILDNLIGNAIKFTDKGNITVGINQDEDFVKIWVKDTGSGIEKQNMNKLFHKFARIDSSYTIATESGGTGLGLYIVKLYTEGMGGQVGATSEGAEKGSIFWFTLPKPQITRYAGITSLKEVNVPVNKITTIK